MLSQQSNPLMQDSVTIMSLASPAYEPQQQHQGYGDPNLITEASSDSVGSSVAQLEQNNDEGGNIIDGANGILCPAKNNKSEFMISPNSGGPSHNYAIEASKQAELAASPAGLMASLREQIIRTESNPPLANRQLTSIPLAATNSPAATAGRGATSSQQPHHRRPVSGDIMIRQTSGGMRWSKGNQVEPSPSYPSSSLMYMAMNQV